MGCCSYEGTGSFAPGQTKKRLQVYIHNDSHDDGISGRMAAPRTAGAHGTIAEQALSLGAGSQGAGSGLRAGGQARPVGGTGPRTNPERCPGEGFGAGRAVPSADHDRDRDAARQQLHGDGGEGRHPTPKLEIGARDYTLGWRLSPEASANAPDLSFGAKATRRENDATAPEHTVGFEAILRW